MGVRDGSAARARDEADPRQLGPGRVGTGPGRAGTEPRAAGRLHEAGEAVMTTPEDRLAELGLKVPAVAKPVAAYVPAVRAGNFVYTSGQLPMVDGALPKTGKVGAEVTAEEAKELAQQCALNALA